MSVTELEGGEARWAGGRVVSVYDSHRQAILQADVAVAATTLGPLDTVYPFNAEGGDVAVMLPEAAGPLTYTYDAVDYDAATLHLVAGPGVVLTAGSVVRPDPALIDRLADVREGTQADPITCRVPYAMRPWLPLGTRTEGQGEEVLYGPTTGAGYVLHDVLGAIPLLVEGGSGVGDMPVGTVMAWPDDVVPARWLRCDGATHLVADYPELGLLLGSRYGGDGATTFAVPNLTARFPRGAAGDPGAAADVATHAHGATGLNVQGAGDHDHGSADLVTNDAGGHDHGAGNLNAASAGGHGHDSASGHSHGTGSLGTGGPRGTFSTQSGVVNMPSSSHDHAVSGSTASGGSHGHGSAGAHNHNVGGTTGGVNAHGHNVIGRTTTSATHAHGLSGSSPAVGHLPPYLELVWVIKATPGGDPLADGTYIEVRDEGVPDVPAATALDFRGAGVSVDPSGPVAVVNIGAQAGVTDHGALTGLADDDHLQYLNTARGDVRYALVAHLHTGTYEPAGATAAHVAAPDAHPGYLTPSEGNAAYEALGAVSTHAGMADPHAAYATDSEVATAIDGHQTIDPHPGELSELGDVEATGAGQGDVLTYRGGVWHGEPPAGVGGLGIAATFATTIKTANQNIVTGTTIGIGMVADQNPVNVFDDANDRFVLTEGIWAVRFAVFWSAANTRSGRSYVILSVDGANYRRAALGIDTVPQSQEVSSIVVVPEGTTKYVSLTVSQNNGAAMTIESTTSSSGGTFGEATLIGSLPPSMRLPNVNVSVGPQEGAAPLIVDAHVENIGGTVTAYDWDWGDGSAHSSGADAQHTYSTAGTRTVTCTATGPKGTDTDTATVVVS